MQKRIVLLICFITFSGYAQKGMKNFTESKKKIQLQNEVIFFMKFTDDMGDAEMKKRNIYSVTKYDIGDVTHYKISKDGFYRKDFISVRDDEFVDSGPTVEKELNSFKLINDKLICLYGNDDLLELQKKKKIPKKFYASKADELRSDYKSFSVTLVLNNKGLLDVKRLYMSYDDSTRYANFRNKKMRRYRKVQ